ncbi:YppG family protein [Aquibacillus saliphilus]|uniref:YppG family protein n=1 Tax=Aquibacillus saliphilus TaxID=1909422 RepID=UPI001CF09D00|nr:YppG family protein [Aquibacillus saliphilus]
MNNWRSSYYPHYYSHTPSLPYSAQAHSPNGEITPQEGVAPNFVTPYEHFAKPQQPLQTIQQAQWSNQYPPVGAPGQSLNQPPKNLMSYFQDKNGQVDIDKMLNTVGQMANTYHQVSPIVKGIGSFMKGFR